MNVEVSMFKHTRLLLATLFILISCSSGEKEPTKTTALDIPDKPITQKTSGDTQLPAKNVPLVTMDFATKPTTSLITRQKLLHFYPKLQPEFLNALNDPQLYIKYKITTPRRLAHFMAQIAHESAGLRRITENMNYSSGRLLQVFGRSLAEEKSARAIKAKELHKKPQAIANWVYGYRMGNRGRHTNDGWIYRGSGFIQLTGREGFIKYGKHIGENIVDNPDKARTPEIGIKTALAYWDTHNLNQYADMDDFCTIRRKINGGLNGIDETYQWYQRALLAFDTNPATIPDENELDGKADVKAVLDILAERGFKLRTYDTQSENLRAALLRYQRSRKLPLTGAFDLDTLIALSDHREHDMATDRCPSKKRQ